jgi:hypothetical protein
MYLFDYLTNNYIFMSGAFLLNMFGGRMLFQDIQPHLHNKFYLKYIFIFCLFFIATKDINISLILIIIYIIFMQFLNDFKINKSENKKEIDLKEELNKCTQMLEDIKSKM